MGAPPRLRAAARQGTRAVGLFSTSAEEGLELAGVDHGDAELPRLLQLAARLAPGGEPAGLLRDAAGHLAARGLDALLHLVAALARERPGEDERLARQRAL